MHAFDASFFVGVWKTSEVGVEILLLWVQHAIG
jgi:hypothetical protein